ncbi:hypothetical protein GCM10010232_31920 [Streptomyces amakusaensis]|uniref:Integral membrane protein n=1 Tax=Streptomyces amakusaensis TaxID=67271 RepID=A0ABW0AJE8_9ACTN
MPRNPSLARPAAGRRTLTGLAASAASAGAYALCIPWDLRNRAAEPGGIDGTTPVSVLGFLSLALVMLALSCLLSRLGVTALWTGLAVGTPVSALMLVSFLTHMPEDSDMWPVAWLPLTLLAVSVPAVVALLTAPGNS